jgi:hypothetical protein
MNKNDLRIGSLVHTTWADIKDPRPLPIIRIENGKGIDEAQWWLPIPITDERLLLLGFRLRGRKWSWPANGMTLNYFYLRKMKDHYLASREGVALCKVKHIHELQNIYHALTGETLTFDK